MRKNLWDFYCMLEIDFGVANKFNTYWIATLLFQSFFLIQNLFNKNIFWLHFWISVQMHFEILEMHYFIKYIDWKCLRVKRVLWSWLLIYFGSSNAASWAASSSGNGVMASRFSRLGKEITSTTSSIWSIVSCIKFSISNASTWSASSKIWIVL